MDYGKQIEDGLTKIGEQLVPYAKEGWDILVFGMRIEGFIAMGVFGCWVAIALFVGRRIGKWDEDSRNIWIVILIFAGIISFFVGVYGLACVLIPEYCVLKSLISK